ncbi:hypothetical protein [Streptomyces acidiscabies]|uniref:hypothetical protein n=1 Tax=Streptomyces acidiscabies TaxID=42234 RepID=UPI00067B2D98|nr:hypothetical protein [Streptomyces acidiscabies]
MLAADVDIKVISETLGHSDTRITRDIYQPVLDGDQSTSRTFPRMTPPPQKQEEPETTAESACQHLHKAEPRSARTWPGFRLSTFVKVPQLAVHRRQVALGTALHALCAFRRWYVTGGRPTALATSAALTHHITDKKKDQVIKGLTWA